MIKNMQGREPELEDFGYRLSKSKGHLSEARLPELGREAVVKRQVLLTSGLALETTGPVSGEAGASLHGERE